MDKLTVERVFEDTRAELKLKLVTDKSSFSRVVDEPNLHRPGLALTGFVDVFTFHRIQVIGNTENAYLRKLSPTQRSKSIAGLLSFEIPCIIVTEDNDLPAGFVELAREKRISIFKSPLATTQLMQLLSDYLDDKFAPGLTVHGSLVDVYGVGLMMTGRSGIGKSEIALDLVERGHRLVSDDIVQISRKAEGILIGKASEMLRHHMEIRGVGIVDVQSMFGIRAIRLQKRVEVEVLLEELDENEVYERTGLHETTTTILGVEIPQVRLPIFPGKNVTVIAEAVALQHLLKINGINSAERFNEKLIRTMGEKAAKAAAHLEDYLEKDFE